MATVESLVGYYQLSDYQYGRKKMGVFFRDEQGCTKVRPLLLKEGTIDRRRQRQSGGSSSKAEAVVVVGGGGVSSRHFLLYIFTMSMSFFFFTSNCNYEKKKSKKKSPEPVAPLSFVIYSRSAPALEARAFTICRLSSSAQAFSRAVSPSRSWVLVIQVSVLLYENSLKRGNSRLEEPLSQEGDKT